MRKYARTVRSGGGWKRTYGDGYTGTKLETADTGSLNLTGHAPALDPTAPTRYAPFVCSTTTNSKACARCISNLSPKK